jgi:hypothetical protein
MLSVGTELLDDDKPTETVSDGNSRSTISETTAATRTALPVEDVLLARTLFLSTVTEDLDEIVSKVTKDDLLAEPLADDVHVLPPGFPEGST